MLPALPLPNVVVEITPVLARESDPAVTLIVPASPPPDKVLEMIPVVVPAPAPVIVSCPTTATDTSPARPCPNVVAEISPPPASDSEPAVTVMLPELPMLPVNARDAIPVKDE